MGPHKKAHGRYVRYKNGKSIVNYNAEKTGKTETKNGAQARATQHVDNRKKHMMAFYISTVEINFNSERKKKVFNAFVTPPFMAGANILSLRDSCVAIDFKIL